MKWGTMPTGKSKVTAGMHKVKGKPIGNPMWIWFATSPCCGMPRKNMAVDQQMKKREKPAAAHKLHPRGAWSQKVAHPDRDSKFSQHAHNVPYMFFFFL